MHYLSRMHIVHLTQHIAIRYPGKLLRLSVLALLALIYTPGAALVLLIGCAHLLGDGIADWHQARRNSRSSRRSRRLPDRTAL